MNSQAVRIYRMSPRSVEGWACKRADRSQHQRAHRTRGGRNVNILNTLYELVDLAARERFESHRQPL